MCERCDAKDETIAILSVEYKKLSERFHKLVEEIEMLERQQDMERLDNE